MSADALAIALLRRLGGDVVISEAELASAARCSVRITQQDDALAFQTLAASGVPLNLSLMEGCNAPSR